MSDKAIVTATGKPKRARRFHTDEFKARAVAIVHSGEQGVSAVARDLKIAESLLRGWVKAAEANVGTAAGKHPGSIIAEHFVEALRPEKLMEYEAGRPKKTGRPPKEVTALVHQTPRAQLSLQLDQLSAKDMEPLARLVRLAKKAGMSTGELVGSMLDMVLLEGLKSIAGQGGSDGD